MVKDISISSTLLEAILRGKKVAPADLNPVFKVDKYILEFCGWEKK